MFKKTTGTSKDSKAKIPNKSGAKSAAKSVAKSVAKSTGKKSMKSAKNIIIDDTKEMNKFKHGKHQEDDRDEYEDQNKNYIDEEEKDIISDGENEIDDEDKNLSNENTENDEDDEEDEQEEKDDKDDGTGEKEEKETKEIDYDEDKCIYNFADDKSEDEEEIFFDDDNMEMDTNIVLKDKRITKPILTKYERVRLLGDRTQQLTLGAKPMIKNTGKLTPKQIAELELKNNVMPLIIERPLPNGKRERWFLKELQH